MKLHIAMLAATLLLSGGASYAQGNKQEKKAKAYMVADAHLDTQWNWDVQTTIKEYVWNTINQNLFLLKKYPNYVFNFEGGVKYAWMKEYYPAQYEEMKKYIGEGRWHISGSSWDATDALVPSTESFIRNIMRDNSITDKNSEWKARTSSCPTVSDLVGHCLLSLRTAA